MMAEIVVSMLLLFSGFLAFVAALGLLRLPDFFLRMHAPALAITLGSWAVALATVVHFSHSSGELSLQAWAIVILLSISAPVTTALLTRAALFRQRRAGDDLPPPLWQQEDEDSQMDEDATAAGVAGPSGERTTGRH